MDSEKDIRELRIGDLGPFDAIDVPAARRIPRLPSSCHQPAVLNGKRRIDPNMASKLGELHRGARFWIEMQAAFDVDQAELR